MAADPRAVVVRAYLEWLRALPPGRSRRLPDDLARALALHPDARAEAEAMHAQERGAAKVAAAFGELRPTKREPAVFRPMTAVEVDLVTRLSFCRFRVGLAGRLVRDLMWGAGEGDLRITDKQAALLPKLAHSYRRQLGGCPVEGCAECAAKESDHG